MTIAIRLASLSLIAAGGLALAACGQQDRVTAENESVESVAEKVAKSDLKPAPGRWESQMKFVKMEMPGMPPEAKAMMEKQMGAVQTAVTCLTPEEAAKPDGEFFRPGNDSGCTYDKFEMGGGNLAAQMTCTQGGQTQKMTMNGTYSPDAYDMNVSADGEVEGKPMSMAMNIVSKRVGDCTGDE